MLNQNYLLLVRFLLQYVHFILISSISKQNTQNFPIYTFPTDWFFPPPDLSPWIFILCANIKPKFHDPFSTLIHVLKHIPKVLDTSKIRHKNWFAWFSWRHNNPLRNLQKLSFPFEASRQLLQFSYERVTFSYIKNRGFCCIETVVTNFFIYLEGTQKGCAGYFKINFD